ncbi:hypothetical protein [Streptomyces sp. RTd22]|uniref:hypothetical protein n=1 Tax=Streptomyces sp. RTd22 TaxID=1841249 RepID=UPI000A8F834A|nr:hypothetical protein [Streptomyces sp. RTd22]
MADLTPSKKPGLSASLTSDWLKGLLRVDQIRHDTLVSLVTGWADDDARDDVIAALDDLAEAMRSPREGELDALVEAVESAAAMDYPQQEFGLADALRLRAELDAVIERLARFNPAAAVLPAQRAAEGGAAA